MREEIEAGKETVDHLSGMVREALARHNEAAYDTRHVKLAAWVAKLWKLRVGEAPIRRSVSNDRQDMPNAKQARNGTAMASGGGGGKSSEEAKHYTNTTQQ